MKITLNELRPLRVSGVRLIPGLNIIPEADAQRILAHPLIAKWVRQGRITTGTSREITVRDVENIYDTGELLALTGSPKKSIAKAAKAQLDRINAHVKPDARKEANLPLDPGEEADPDYVAPREEGASKKGKPGKKGKAAKKDK